MQRVILCAAVLCVAAGLTTDIAVAQRTTVSPAARGRQLFIADGCHQCHGHSGQGSASGPRLAPGPLPLDVFTRQLRNPIAVMPIYTGAVLSDADIADIYAYLNSIPKAKLAAEIPLLNQ